MATAPRPTDRRPLAAALAVIAAAGPLSWWAVGEQSVDGVAGTGLDYAGLDYAGLDYAGLDYA